MLHNSVFLHVYSEQVFTYSTLYTYAESAHGFARFQIVLVNEFIPINSTLNYPNHLIETKAATNSGHDNDSNADSAQ